MIVPNIIINDEVYHPILKEIVFYPPPDLKIRYKNGRKKFPGNVFKKRKRIRGELWQQDKKCFYCKRSLLYEESTLDHKIPVSKGGSEDKENFVLSCRDCNTEKGSSSFEEFIEKDE